MWFDTHAHLSDSKFDSDRDETIRRALEAGVSRIVEIADGPAEWPKAQALSENHPDHVWWTAGIHPYYADKATPDVLSALRETARHPHMVAFGEIGLDYAKCPIPRDVQIRTFQACLAIARDERKPVVIHCRDAYGDLLPILREHAAGETEAHPGVIHCFSGGPSDARACVELGYFIGVDGPVTYPNANALRDALAFVPADRLVVETDAPYLPPQSRRGQRNEPALLPEIGARLAGVANLPVGDIRHRLTENAFRLFRRKPA